MYNKFSDFLDGLLHYGLEKFGRYYGAYRGTVTSNEDPQNLGRLQISCQPLYGDQKPDYWAWPRGNMAGSGHGIFWIPQPGDPIYVSCENGDCRFPLWEYGWWTKNNVPSGAKPRVYVFLTAKGQRIEMNDESNSIQIKQKDGFNIKIAPDGIFLGKDDKNLGKFLDDLFQLLEATTVTTTTGSVPFNNLADYIQLHLKIAQFLKTS